MILRTIKANAIVIVANADRAVSFLNPYDLPIGMSWYFEGKYYGLDSLPTYVLFTNRNINKNLYVLEKDLI